jgi:hypothetical protein
MRRKSVTTFCSGLLVFFFVCLIVGAGAQVESFYRGKNITIVVGYNPGDAHDLWARAYSRTMGRYIPGVVREELEGLAREVVVQPPEVIERMKQLLGE